MSNWESYALQINSNLTGLVQREGEGRQGRKEGRKEGSKGNMKTVSESREYLEVRILKRKVQRGIERKEGRKKGRKDYKVSKVVAWQGTKKKCAKE